MISTFALVVIGAFQLAFIVAMLVLLSTTHRKSRGEQAADVAAIERLRAPLQALVMGEDHGEALARALGKIDREIAIRHVLTIATSQLAPEQTRDLAERLRPARWVERTLAQGTSRRWWKRMEAARLLAVVNSPADLPLLARLVCDDHPAVASAATAAIGSQANSDFIGAIIRGLYQHPPAVRHQQMRALRNHADVATPLVVAQLHAGPKVSQLCTLVELAERLGTPAALAAVVPFASHAEVEVRVAVARALRSCFLPDAVVAARQLLADSDWRVRAAAARALAGLNAREAIPEIRRAMGDTSWWVRFRAALALGLLGEEGAEALAAAAGSNDEFARDMAILVRGLSEPAILELNT